MSQSISTSTIWGNQIDDVQLNQKSENNNNDNSDDILIPKQEPIYGEYTPPQYLTATPSMPSMASMPPSTYDPTQQLQQYQPYYPNGYYLNYDNAHLLYPNDLMNQQ